MNSKKVSNKNKFYLIAIIILLIIIFISIYIPYTNAIKITQLKNNGHSQMMGYIIQTKSNKTIVIDGGTHDDSENLINHIRNTTNKVDTWFITHPHNDHASVIIDVINNTDIQIDNIYVTLNDISWYERYEPERAENAKNLIEALQNERIRENVHEVSLHQEIQIDNINCEILGIKNPEIVNSQPGNNSSMVIRMKVNNKVILFLGDTAVESQNKLLENNSKEKLKADIVQMAHHGQNGVNEEFYRIVNPKICMWPTPDWLWTNNSGAGEDSGDWLTKTTRKWMENLGVKQNIIEKDGDITLKVW